MYVVILAIKFLLDIENLFYDKQDSVVVHFLESLTMFCTFHNVISSFVSNKWLTRPLYAPRCKSYHKIQLRECLEMFISTARYFFLHTGFHLTYSETAWMVCHVYVQTSNALLSVDQLHYLFLSSVLVFEKRIFHLQIAVINIWWIIFTFISHSYNAI